MNSASEPAICSGPVPIGEVTWWPSASSATGACSPSNVAVPPAELTHQFTFHDVSSPAAHQLPEKENRVPSANSNATSAAASPRYQLQLGLYDSQYTATGSEPISTRARSNWWI